MKEIFVATPIYKPDRLENERYKKSIVKLFKSLKKRLEKPEVSELNQFMIGTAILEEISLEKREKFEQKIHKIYLEHTKRTLKNQKKRLKNDPELISTIFEFREFNKHPAIEISDEINQLENVIADAMEQVSEILHSGYTIIWMENTGITRLKSGSEVIEIAQGLNGDLTDEIALASFGNSHVPPLCEDVTEIVSELMNFITNINSYIDKIKSVPDKRFQKHFGELSSIILGKILGIRETIIATRKQIRRYKMLRDEMISEAQQSAAVYDYFFDLDQLNQTIDSLSKLEIHINQNYLNLRSSLNSLIDLPIQEADTKATEEFAKYSIKIYRILDKLRFVTETFEDIGNFTSISGKYSLNDELAPEILEGKDNYVIYAHNVFKTFPLINNTVYALRGVDLAIKQGEFIAIMGPSGSGKTTLLNILSGLDTADIGFVFVDGVDIARASERKKIQMRKDTFSFIYQSYNLLPVLQNIENVTLPADYGSKNIKKKKRERGRELLEQVGLGQYIKTRPLLLSGGQQQRVTVARAFMNRPKIIFCDEPTGDLDRNTGNQVMDIIDELHKQGTAIVLVTHDNEVAKRADRIIKMTDGKIIEEIST